MPAPTPSAAFQVALDRFLQRVIQEALTSATAQWWQHRAEVFDQARPRPGDHPGQATAAEISAQDSRLAATAQACRAHARILAGEFDG